MEGALPPGHMVNGLGKQQNRLSGRCPDHARCTLPVWCSDLCLRLEATEIAELLQARAVLAGGREESYVTRQRWPFPAGICCGRAFWTWEGWVRHRRGHEAGGRKVT